MCLAVPGRVVSIAGDDVMRSGRVDFGGLTKEINLAFVPEARIEDYVLVHVGFAITVIDAAEAARIIEALAELEELQERGETGELEGLEPHGDGGARP